MPRVGFLEKSHISGIRKIVFENGITVFLENLPEQIKVVLLVGVGVGSSDEPNEMKGASHFLSWHGASHFAEHAHFISTAIHSAYEIIEGIEYGGGAIFAGTDFDHTEFHVKSYPKHLPRNIGIIYEIIKNLRYKEDELEKQKLEVITEIRDELDSPKESHIPNLFFPVLFRKTPFEKQILGTPKSVRHFSRENLVKFKKKFYVPSNIVIFICGNFGNFDEERLIENIKKTFGCLKPRTLEREELKIYLANRRRKKIKQRKNLKLAYLAIGDRVPGHNHPDSLKLMFLSSILSGGRSSRLPKKLQTEKGIGYDEVKSIYEDFGGTCAFYVTIGGFDSLRFNEAKKIILEELEDLRNNLVTKREFIRAKNLLISRIDDDTFDIETRTGLLSEAYFRKSIFDPRNLKKYISKISRESLRRTAQKYFTDRYTLAALVPENFKK